MSGFKLPDFLAKAANAAAFADPMKNGGAPTWGDAFQGIGNSMMAHYNGVAPKAVPSAPTMMGPDSGGLMPGPGLKAPDPHSVVPNVAPAVGNLGKISGGLSIAGLLQALMHGGGPQAQTPQPAAPVMAPQTPMAPVLAPSVRPIAPPIQMPTVPPTAMPPGISDPRIDAIAKLLQR